MPVAAPPPVFEAAVSPARVGKAAKVHLSIEGKSTNARELIVYFPQGLAISNAGLADGTKAGSGSITVDDTPAEIAPTVSATGLRFAVADTVFDGVFAQASGRYTAKLRVKVPQPLRAFTALTLDLKAKSLFTTRACPLPFRVELIGAKRRALNAEAPCRQG